MALLNNIKAVIYDLDGTIINTERLHQEAWELTSIRFNLGFSGDELYLASKGISSKKTLENMLPQDRYDIIAEVAERKFRYFMEIIESSTIDFLPGFMETFETLRRYDLKLGICTSARKENVEVLQRNKNSEISSVLDYLNGKVAWQEMFNEGKPAAEPLLMALSMVDADATDTIYIGDGFADYQCAQYAAVKEFVYFWDGVCAVESRIPDTITRMSDHRELLKLL